MLIGLANELEAEIRLDRILAKNYEAEGAASRAAALRAGADSRERQLKVLREAIDTLDKSPIVRVVEAGCTVLVPETKWIDESDLKKELKAFSVTYNSFWRNYTVQLAHKD